MKRMKTSHHTLEIHGLLVACLALATSVGLAAGMEEAAGTGSSGPASSLRVPLEWQESSEPFDTCPLRFAPEVKPFLKEPDFGQDRVVRGAFGFGFRTNELMAFAWDQTANRLYLDRNGNRDLTDDAEATYAGEYEGFLQLFPRVKLDWGAPSGSHRYLVDLRLGGTTGASLQGTCVLRSFWQGRVELNGRPYQIGLVQNPNAKTAADEARHFLFRAWDARAEPIRLNPGTPHLVRWSPRVFLAGRGFDVGLRSTNQAGSPRYVLDLRPAQPQLGELRVNGQHLYRLILTQPNGFEAILDQPGPTEKLPVGTYQTGEVWLRQGAGEAFYIGPLPLTVRADAPTSLALGGPLTNTVTAQQVGENLVLRYRLAGTGSRALDYRISTETQPPGWAIWQGDKQVASGKFAYG